MGWDVRCTCFFVRVKTDVEKNTMWFRTTSWMLLNHVWDGCEISSHMFLFSGWSWGCWDIFLTRLPRQTCIFFNRMEFRILISTPHAPLAVAPTHRIVPRSSACNLLVTVHSIGVLGVHRLRSIISLWTTRKTRSSSIFLRHLMLPGSMPVESTSLVFGPWTNRTPEKTGRMAFQHMHLRISDSCLTRVGLTISRYFQIFADFMGIFPWVLGWNKLHLGLGCNVGNSEANSGEMVEGILTSFYPDTPQKSNIYNTCHEIYFGSYLFRFRGGRFCGIFPLVVDVG